MMFRYENEEEQFWNEVEERGDSGVLVLLYSLLLSPMYIAIAAVVVV